MVVAENLVAVDHSRRSEWPQLSDTTLHLNGIEQRYF